MIKIKRSKDRLYYFVIVARNGQVLATSETYKNRRNCLKGIDALDYVMAGYRIVDETV